MCVPRGAAPSGKDIEPSCKRKNESAKHNSFIENEMGSVIGLEEASQVTPLHVGRMFPGGRPRCWVELIHRPSVPGLYQRVFS